MKVKFRVVVELASVDVAYTFRRLFAAIVAFEKVEVAAPSESQTIPPALKINAPAVEGVDETLSSDSNVILVPFVLQ